ERVVGTQARVLSGGKERPGAAGVELDTHAGSGGRGLGGPDARVEERDEVLEVVDVAIRLGVRGGRIRAVVDAEEGVLRRALAGHVDGRDVRARRAMVR